MPSLLNAVPQSVLTTNLVVVVYFDQVNEQIDTAEQVSEPSFMSWMVMVLGSF